MPFLHSDVSRLHTLFPPPFSRSHREMILVSFYPQRMEISFFSSPRPTKGKTWVRSPFFFFAVFYVKETTLLVHEETYFRPVFFSHRREDSPFSLAKSDHFPSPLSHEGGPPTRVGEDFLSLVFFLKCRAGEGASTGCLLSSEVCLFLDLQEIEEREFLLSFSSSRSPFRLPLPSHEKLDWEGRISEIGGRLFPRISRSEPRRCGALPLNSMTQFSPSPTLPGAKEMGIDPPSLGLSLNFLRDLNRHSPPPPPFGGLLH